MIRTPDLNSIGDDCYSTSEVATAKITDGPIAEMQTKMVNVNGRRHRSHYEFSTES